MSPKVGSHSSLAAAGLTLTLTLAAAAEAAAVGVEILPGVLPAKSGLPTEDVLESMHSLVLNMGGLVGERGAGAVPNGERSPANWYLDTCLVSKGGPTVVLEICSSGKPRALAGCKWLLLAPA